MKEKKPRLLIVSHGQPSDPEYAAQYLRGFAASVAAHLDGWSVSGVTLAESDALERDVAGECGQFAFVYPLFMARGWFVETYLKERLAKASTAQWKILDPFGTDDAVHSLACRILSEAGLQAGGEVLIAAHGSSRSAAPAQIAQNLAQRIAQTFGTSRAEAYFIDQSPQIASSKGFSSQAFCLPFFAAQGEHITDDLPDALAQAGFEGKVLPPIGLDPRVPELVAASCRAAALRV